MSSLPLTCDPWAEQEPLGFSVSFAPRRYRRRTSRWGQVTTLTRSHVVDISRPSNPRTHLPRATSCRKHYAYLPFRIVVDTCATLPCERLSRSPWWGVTPTTTIGTPS